MHVTGVEANVQISRGQRQAFLRGVRLPRRGKAGHSVTRDARAASRPRAAGAAQGQAAAAGALRAGPAPQVVFAGTDVDSSEGDLSRSLQHLGSTSSSAARAASSDRASLRRLVAAIEGIGRYDGVSARPPSGDPETTSIPASRPTATRTLRISGKRRATIRIRR